MSTDAYDVIRRDVHARIERRRLRPDADLEEVRVEVGRAVDDYQRVRAARRGAPARRPGRHGRAGAALHHRLRCAHRAARPARRRGDLHRGGAGVVPRRIRAPAGADRADQRGREPAGRRAPAGRDRPAAQHQASDGAGPRARRHRAPHRGHPAGRRPAVGDLAALRRAQRHARRPRRARLALAGSRGVPPRAHAAAEPGRGLG